MFMNLSDENENSVLNFESAGLFVSRGEWIHAARTVMSYEIIFVLSGRVFIREEEIDYVLEKNDVLLLSPGKMHKGTRPSRGVSFYWLHFTSDIVFGRKYFRLSDTAQLVGFFRTLLHIKNTPFYPESSAVYMTRLILGEISFLSRRGESSKNPAYMAAEYISSNAALRLSAAEAAEHLGYNADYLCRLFKKTYGMTIKKFIAEETVKKAKLLLTESGKSISDTAEALCFENENLFTKFFKYHEGVTPSQYIQACYNTHINRK